MTATDGTSTEQVAEAIKAVIDGVVPGASCDGDWLITGNGIRVSITGMAVLAARAAIDALIDSTPMLEGLVNPCNCGNSHDWCLNKLSPDGYFCTQPEGHIGDHRAEDQTNWITLAVWDNP